ncbi:tyrosine-type recombinase/integrase [Streptomyces varsoviensis]|uniref:tyrosine-type recombinase/integrase n=1 Tax=Streptomyces varsoviensis TaxID=67373 RepID=UPI0033FB3C9B
MVAQILGTYGGKVEDITIGDVLATWQVSTRNGGHTIRRAYRWLRDAGQFPADAPVTLRHIIVRSGQVGPAELVDRYQLRCRGVRDLIVDYLTERQLSLDYSSLRQLSTHLAGYFWADLERHNPGIDSLNLPKEVAEGWKERIGTKIVRRGQAGGTTSQGREPRAYAPVIKTSVRAFYLDLAQWALDEPHRWGSWAVPCPIRETECSVKRLERQQKVKSDQRTRERLPVLPALVRTASRRLKEARTRLDALSNASLGSSFTALGEDFTTPKSTRRSDGRPATAYDAEGRRRDLRAEEKIAFWGWATIEILRHTGLRIEELRELSHHSIIRYNLPTTGEVVPLLQIAPSKTDQERLILVSPELADVLSTVVSRVRGADGSVPSVHSYDIHEKVWNAPMPLLCQWEIEGERYQISENTIRKALNEALAASGLTDAEGAPLKFQPHDFRRILITDVILNGMPPHIAQVIAGHGNINTTMGYNSVYPSDAIEAHRAFIARRRSVRPPEEYRAVTPEEWREFLGHFERRKLSLGSCGRAYGADCIHEHACVRCPVLIVDFPEVPRLIEIRDNLRERIAEAEREGWFGDVEGLSVSLAAAEEKIAQLDARRAQKDSPVFLGIPSFKEAAGRISAVASPTHT